MPCDKIRCKIPSALIIRIGNFNSVFCGNFLQAILSAERHTQKRSEFINRIHHRFIINCVFVNTHLFGRERTFKTVLHACLQKCLGIGSQIRIHRVYHLVRVTVNGGSECVTVDLINRSGLISYLIVSEAQNSVLNRIHSQRSCCEIIYLIAECACIDSCVGAMLVTCKHHFYTPVGKKLSRCEMELHDKVSAEKSLNGKMVEEIMVHHNNGISSVLLCKLGLLLYP